MWETIRGYLTFTRKERNGVLFLLILICILFALPYFFRPAIGDPDPAVYEKLKEGIRQFESNPADSPGKSMNHYHDPEFRQYGEERASLRTTRQLPAELFYFDPNRINSNEWQRLGLSERLAETILHYIGKGGHFRKAEDLQKLYGLHHSDYERISPFVRITKTPGKFQNGSGYYAKSAYDLHAVKKADSFFRSPVRMNGNEGITYTAKKLEPTDINQADSADWSRLPGIGAKLASRIIHFREKLGGFYSVNQVSETFGLPDSGFQKIKPCLQLNAFSLNRIDLNSATKESLQAHPYIRWQIARGIIEYRQQHGSFHSVDELLQLALMDSAIFEKIKRYVVVRP